MENNLIMDTFHSEVVTDEDEDEEQDEDEDDVADSNPLLMTSRGDRGLSRPRERRKESVRTRVVYNLFQLKPGVWWCHGWRCLSVLLLVLTSTGVLFYLSAEVESSSETPGLRPSTDYLDFRQPENMVTFHEMMEENFTFNVSSTTDVMVFLHIQKTGGTTFGKHLVEDIDLARPCECQRRTKNRKSRRKFHCDCFRPGSKESNWLFSRYSTGWKW